MICDLIKNGTSVGVLRFMVMLVFLVIAAVLSITVHEYGHSVVLRKFGADGTPSLNPVKSLHLRIIPSILMLALFSVTWLKAPVIDKKTELSRGRKILTALSGSAANIVFAFLCIVIYDILYVIGAKISAAGSDVVVIPWISAFFSECVIVSVSYAVFNLIPAPQTDGGMIISALLPEKASEKFDSFRYSYLILFFIAVVLMRSGGAEAMINAVSSVLETPVLALFNLILKAD